MSAGLILSAGIVVYLLICVVWARIRGVTRSRIRMFTVIFSAVVAFIATLVVKNMVASDTLREELHSFANSNGMEFLTELSEISPVIEEIVLKTSGALLAPMIFLILFSVLSLVTWVLYFVVTLVLFVVIHRKEKTRTFKGVPCLINGLIQGVICVAVLLVPISTYFSIVPKITGEISLGEGDGNAEIIEELGAQAESVNKSPAVVIFRTAGGKLMCSAFTDYSVDNGGQKVKVKLDHEIDAILKLVSGVKDISGKEMSAYTAEDAEALEELGRSVGDSDIVTLIASELVHNATEAWKNGESFAGMEKPAADDITGTMLDKMIDILYAGSETTATFKEDIQTLTKLMSKLIEKNVIQTMGGDTEQLVSAISQKGVITDIASVLGSNDRMKVLIPELTNLSVKILAQSLGIPENDEEVYNTMLANVAEKLNDLRLNDSTLTEEEKISSVKTTLNTEFAKVGLDVNPEYVSDVAEALVKDFGDSEVTVEAIFVSEFFEIYSEYLEANDETVGDIAYNGGALFEKLGGMSGESEDDGKGDGNKYTYYKYRSDYGNDDKEEQGGQDGQGGQNAQGGSSAAANLGKKHKNESNNNEGGSDGAQGSNDSKKLASLKDHKSAGENFNTATMEGLFGGDDGKDYGDYTEDDIQNEAEALEKILGLVSSVIGGSSDPDNDGEGDGKTDGDVSGDGEGSSSSSSTTTPSTGDIIKGIGEVLDGLSSTESFGKEKTDALFNAILNSEKVGDIISDEEKQGIMDGLSGSDGLTYGELMNGVSSIVDLVESIAKEGAETIDMDLAKTLIRSLTEANVEALSGFITGNRFGNLGIPEEKLDAATDLIKELLTEIGKFADEESIDSEAGAVKHIIDIALTAKSGSGNALFGDDGRLKCTADDMVELIMSSTAVRSILDDENITFDPFGLVRENDGHKINATEREAIKTACEDYYASHASDAGVDSAKLAKELRALSSILGINIDL